MKGVYTLIIHLAKDKRIRIGNFGEFNFPSGFYSYTGSAMGFNAQSLEGRITRYLLKTGRMRWHIDWLLMDDDARILVILTKSSKTRLECRVNQTIKRACQAIVQVTNFGSTDCRSGCGSHLLYFGYKIPIYKVKEVYKEI